MIKPRRHCLLIAVAVTAHAVVIVTVAIACRAALARALGSFLPAGRTPRLRAFAAALDALLAARPFYGFACLAVVAAMTAGIEKEHKTPPLVYVIAAQQRCLHLQSIRITANVLPPT